MSHPPAQPPSPLKRLLHSFGYAFSGLWYVIKTQQNMRIHLGVTACVILLGLYLELRYDQWAILGLTVGFVMVAEMFNTVAEAAMDATVPHYHPLIKTAKDVAAGAVLITSLISVCVGLLILGPPLWRRIYSWLQIWAN